MSNVHAAHDVLPVILSQRLSMLSLYLSCDSFAPPTALLTSTLLTETVKAQGYSHGHDDNLPFSRTEKLISNRRVLVTGGTKGIGKAVVRRFRLAGARVAATAHTAPDLSSSSVMYIAADLSKPAGVSTVVEHLRQEWGGVDVLIKDVGGSETGPGALEVLTNEDWHEVLGRNLLATVRLDRAFLVPAYFIFTREKTRNVTSLEQYRAMVPACFEGHTVKLLAHHGQTVVLEGPATEDVLILEFPNFEATQSWYESKAYQAACELRFQGGDYRAILTEDLG